MARLRMVSPENLEEFMRPEEGGGLLTVMRMMERMSSAMAVSSVVLSMARTRCQRMAAPAAAIANSPDRASASRPILDGRWCSVKFGGGTTLKCLCDEVESSWWCTWSLQCSEVLVQISVRYPEDPRLATTLSVTHNEHSHIHQLLPRLLHLALCVLIGAQLLLLYMCRLHQNGQARHCPQPAASTKEQSITHGCPSASPPRNTVMAHDSIPLGP